MNKTRVLLAAAAAGAVSTVLHCGLLPWPVGYSDVLHLFPVALAPGWPYVDRPVEYPVLTGLFMRALGWLGGTAPAYYALTAGALAGAAALCAGLLCEEAPARRVLRRWCLAPSLVWLLVYNWDALAVLCAVAGLVLVKRRQALESGVAFALGFCFKLYPALYLLPALVAWRKEPQLSARLLLGFAATAVAVNLPFALMNYSGWSFCFAFNFAAERLPNPDSIWSVLRFLLGGPRGAAAGTLSALLFLPGLAWTLWRLRDAGVIALGYGATAVMLLTAKFFSPQYALWLLPFFALDEVPAGWAYGFESANLAVLFTVLHYLLTSQSKAWYEACALFVVLRHACLAGLLRAHLYRSRAPRP